MAKENVKFLRSGDAALGRSRREEKDKVAGPGMWSSGAARGEGRLPAAPEVRPGPRERGPGGRVVSAPAAAHRQWKGRGARGEGKGRKGIEDPGRPAPGRSGRGLGAAGPRVGAQGCPEGARRAPPVPFPGRLVPTRGAFPGKWRPLRGAPGGPASPFCAGKRIRIIPPSKNFLSQVAAMPEGPRLPPWPIKLYKEGVLI